MTGDEVEDIGIFCSPGFKKQSHFDAIIIHWGWLEHVRDKYKIDLEKMIRSFKKFSPRIIITSGRGMTKEIPHDLPFLEFSAIQNYVMGEFSKYHVGKIVFSILGKKEEISDERNTSNDYQNEQ